MNELIINLQKRLPENITFDDICWFFAYQAATRLADESTKSLARILLEGLPPIDENYIAYEIELSGPEEWAEEIIAFYEEP